MGILKVKKISPGASWDNIWIISSQLRGLFMQINEALIIWNIYNKLSLMRTNKNILDKAYSNLPLR